MSTKLLGFTLSLLILLSMGKVAHGQDLQAQGVTEETLQSEAEATASAPAAEAKAEDPIEPGLLPSLAWFLPGILVHGSGTFAAGDTETGLDLLVAEGVGLAALGTGIGVLALTGASRKLAGSPVALTAAGAGLFFTSWSADLYGAALGYRDASNARPTRAQLHIGARYVDDPVFTHHGFMAVGGDIQLDRYYLSFEHLNAIDEESRRSSLSLGARILGALPGENWQTGALDLQLASSYDAFPQERFSILTVEGETKGRLDLEWLGYSLAGSFVQANLGWAMQFFDYHLPGLELGEDSNEMLLLGFGYGLYFGEGAGEALLYYDHRRDGFTGGLSGFVGRFGLAGSWNFWQVTDTDWMAIEAKAELGLAALLGLDLVYRWGTP